MALVAISCDHDRAEALCISFVPPTVPTEFDPLTIPSSSFDSLISLGEPDDLPRSSTPFWLQALFYLYSPGSVVKPAPGTHVDVLGTEDGEVVTLRTTIFCEAGSVAMRIEGGCEAWKVYVVGWNDWPVAEWVD
ncbi:hypothetical protein Slin15195_G022670 [Septoria linicola]|uniref:Uncharacterized protein n=1 Tax=Septoria linicola TaxID=215465 RepID=A0A9Q9EH52_9PEZI|nr:hypothetical protein Slin15195_G022670 [Septoria linicola]